MSGPLDRAIAPRPGEEIDPAKLAAWLEAHVPGAAGPLEILQYPSGHSNLTYLVRAGERDMVLRRPPVGSQVKSAHDMGREVRVLGRLAGLYEAPRPLASCDDASVLGAPFYVMERIAGAILRRKPPEGFALGPERARKLGEAFVAQLAKLHAIDWREAGFGELGKPEGYVRRQVEGWAKRWEAARTDPIDDMDTIGAWLAARIPAESGAAIVHNDFKFDNLVLDPAEGARIVGVLDWEMATVGDPLLDLGVALGYWVEPTDPPELRALAFGPTDVPGSPTRREVVELYARATGRDPGDITFAYAFALFKIAVVAQQIYVRWKHGLTKDPRFGRMLDAARALAAEAARTVERGHI